MNTTIERSRASRSFAIAIMAAALLAGPSTPAAASPSSVPAEVVAPHSALTTPEPASSVNLFKAIDLAQPTGLALATTGLECSKHMTLDSEKSKCDPGIANRNVILVWSFAANTCGATPNCSQPASYDILVNSSKYGSFQKTASQTVDPKQTAYVMGEHLDDAVGSCFEVRAVSGTDLGPVSDPVCVAAPPAPANLGILQIRGATAYRFKHENGCFSVGANGATLPHVDNGEAMVGFRDMRSSCDDSFDNYTYQLGLQFDLAPLAGKHLAKAILSMNVKAGLYDNGSGNEAPSLRSCALYVGYAYNQDWLGSLPPTIPYQLFQQLPPSAGKMSVDITDMVLAWLAHKNNGVILTSGGALTDFDNNECVSVYKDLRLTATFKP
jgi:hypothetical protein